MEQNAAFQTIADHWTEIQDYVKNKKVTTELSYEMWIAPLKPHHLTLDEDGRALFYVEVTGKENSAPNSGLHVDALHASHRDRHRSNYRNSLHPYVLRRRK